MERHANINTIETNFRAEVLASGLIATGVEIDKLCIVRHKGDKKDVLKDIDKMEYRYPDFDMMEYLYIFSNREGIYDSLPEGLFHQITSPRLESKEAIIAEMREQRGKENFIRTFFQPFEMAIDKFLIDAQLHELKYDKMHLHNNLANILKEYWPILQLLSTSQMLLFIKSIPMMEDISRDLDLMSKVMSVILDCPVSISQGGKSRLGLTNSNTAKLKDWKLGITSILGDEAEYGKPDLIVNIGPLCLDQMKLLQPGQSSSLILKELINMLLPYDRNVRVKYQINANETKFRLSSKEHTAYLGINTTL